MRSQYEIDELMNRVQDSIDEGGRFFGMSYEDGLMEALRWVTGDSDDDPFPDA